jgi:hypothetical protein
MEKTFKPCGSSRLSWYINWITRIAVFSVFVTLVSMLGDWLKSVPFAGLAFFCLAGFYALCVPLGNVAESLNGHWYARHLWSFHRYHIGHVDKSTADVYTTPRLEKTTSRGGNDDTIAGDSNDDQFVQKDE